MRKWDVNIICLIGAIIGIIAVVLPWYSDSSSTAFLRSPLDSFLEPDDNYVYGLSMMTFFVAVLMSFLTPLAGPIQLISATVALACITSEAYWVPYFFYDPVLSVEPGLWIALSAGIITTCGLIFPYNLSRRKARADIAGRLFTIRPRDFWKTQVNLLCFIGLILSLLSLMVPWGSVESDVRIIVNGVELPRLILGVEFPSFYIMNEQLPISGLFGLSYEQLAAFALAFIVGTLIAFFSPIGGLFQLLGASGYLGMLLIVLGDYRVLTFGRFHADAHVQVGLGVVLALTGAMLVTLSMIFPVGLYRREGPPKMASRLLLWGPPTAD